MSVLLRIIAYLLIAWWVLRQILVFLMRKPARPPSPNASGNAPASSSKDTVKDPICGMYMDPRLAIRLPRKEGDVFFCSEECRERFLGGQT